MEKEELTSAIRATLAVLAALAKKTRTQADDLLVTILRANETRLIEAVRVLMNDPNQPPSDEQVSAALATVGIRV